MFEFLGLIGTLLLVGLVQAFAAYPPTSSQDVAAWVQAVGSVAAIISAVWLFYEQQEKAQRAAADADSTNRKRAEDAERIEVLHMLRSIRDEMVIVVSAFDATSGQNIRNGASGTPHLWTIPIHGEQFPVYKANVAKLGKVFDDDLRRRIILTLGMAQGCVSTILYNNSLIAKFEHARHMKAVMKDPVHDAAFTAEEARLTRYGDTLRLAYQKALDAVNETLPHLHEAMVRLQFR